MAAPEITNYSGRISSVFPQAWQVQVSRLTPRSPKIASGSLAVSRPAGSPQYLHGRPGARFGATSSAASRASIASTRSGASFMRFHSGHLSNSASISERTANVAS